MSDRYQALVNSTVGSSVASRLGLPRPAVLRRYEPGADLLPGPVRLGAAGGSTVPHLREVLTRTGAVVADETEESTRFGALVYDATGISTVAGLAELAAFLGAALRRLRACGRIVVLGRPADSVSIEVDAVRQALEGIVRSLGKELRAGATANLVWITDPASLESALRFLLSGKAAYVDGQSLLLGPSRSEDPVDWARPLAGQVALVTGAARGIGAAITAVLARDGAHVVCADLPAAGASLARVANDVAGTTLQIDITAADAPATVLRHLTERHGGVDIVVHNAGVTRDKLLANMTPNHWDPVLAVNLQAQLSINAALLASDVMRDRGRVVTLSSTTGLAGNRGQTNYGASKAGLIGLVRSSAAAFAARGATINAVAPGFIDTDMTHAMPFATRELARRLNSLQQAGLPVDVAEAVAWLASPGAGGVNGQVLRVCGQNLVGA
ncbi:MAG: 3-oxoacyl-ACP reductase [Actinobacteria bacterium]|nr:3-oxoacyl-ACP reductase [Actinomycetota bacterium]